jgi:microcystin-dependent protein
MPVGESIPLEERLDGRMYYQWFGEPTVRAKCATGTVNLGERPYADCGLYINNVHICVDNTSETAFAIDSEAWVDAINHANCGVTAVNIDGGDDVVFKLSAKNAGSYGNDIPIKFDVAQYGELAGKTYSEGKLSGSRLSGGSDEQSGVSLPTGRFEDAHGNVLSELDNTIGEIKYFAHNKPLGNWLLCDGRAVSRTEYARLYTLIGTTWGEGDGKTTFNLPNLIDRVAWGAKTAGTYKSAGLPSLPSHKHDIGFAHYQVGHYGEKEIGTSHASSGYGSAQWSTKSTYTNTVTLSNNIYGASNTVQPPAATLRPFIKY